MSRSGQPKPEVTPEPRRERTKADDWRIEMYRNLGFAWDDAVTMSRAKDSAGFVVWWGRVKQALDAGWTHAECLEFWSD